MIKMVISSDTYITLSIHLKMVFLQAYIFILSPYLCSRDIKMIISSDIYIYILSGHILLILLTCGGSTNDMVTWPWHTDLPYTISMSMIVAHKRVSRICSAETRYQFAGRHLISWLDFLRDLCCWNAFRNHSAVTVVKM